VYVRFSLFEIFSFIVATEDARQTILLANSSTNIHILKQPTPVDSSDESSEEGVV